MKQGQAAKSSSGQGMTEARAYNINQNWPSQLGSAIDPKARETMMEGGSQHVGPTDGMAEGPGANRTVRSHGGQGSH